MIQGIFDFVETIKSKKNNGTTNLNRTKLRNGRKIYTKKTNLRNKQQQKKKKDIDILSYRIYDSDDETLVKQKDRCMCIDYKMNGNSFSLKHNTNLSQGFTPFYELY